MCRAYSIDPTHSSPEDVAGHADDEELVRPGPEDRAPAAGGRSSPGRRRTGPAGGRPAGGGGGRPCSGPAGRGQASRTNSAFPSSSRSDGVGGGGRGLGRLVRLAVAGGPSPCGYVRQEGDGYAWRSRARERRVRGPGARSPVADRAGGCTIRPTPPRTGHDPTSPPRHPPDRHHPPGRPAPADDPVGPVRHAAGHRRRPSGPTSGRPPDTSPSTWRWSPPTRRARPPARANCGDELGQRPVRRVPGPRRDAQRQPQPARLRPGHPRLLPGQALQAGDDRKVIAPGLYARQALRRPRARTPTTSTRDGRGAVGHDRGVYRFEWAVKLNYGDAQDLKARPGDAVRFNLAFMDGFKFDAKGTQVSSLFGADLDRADHWGTLEPAKDVRTTAGPRSRGRPGPRSTSRT